MPGGLAQAGERELIRITVWGLSPRRECRGMGREHSIWVSVLLVESNPAPHRRCEKWAGDPWATPAILPAPGHGALAAPKIYQDSEPGSAQFHQGGLTSAPCGRQEVSAVCGQGSPPSLPAARARSPGADEESPLGAARVPRVALARAPARDRRPSLPAAPCLSISEGSCCPGSSCGASSARPGTCPGRLLCFSAPSGISSAQPEIQHKTQQPMSGRTPPDSPSAATAGARGMEGNARL